jgi:uncharacterized membrane protein YqgA involved in biofilm formation
MIMRFPVQRRMGFPMTGTLVNTVAVMAGAIAGTLAGKKVSDRFKTILMNALGLSVVLVGVRMALSGKSELLAIGSLLSGGLVGEGLRIEERVGHVGESLKRRFASDSITFVNGFVSASVLFCTGAMSIVGSLQDGTVGDPSVLLIKSLLDATGALVLSSTLGIGVAFSALSVLVYQGAITLLAGSLGFLSLPRVLDALSTTGGVIILGIGLNLLGVTRIRIGNLLPALFIAIAVSFFSG